MAVARAQGHGDSVGFLRCDVAKESDVAAMVAEAGEEFSNLSAKVEPDTLLSKDIALFGTPQEIVAKIMKLKEDVGYEDFMFHSWFELAGSAAAEIEAQMQHFAEECMPELVRL